MATDIERIVDRKIIRQRVHYLVLWKGFGDENNTWESRIDLMADGFSDVIKRFEDERKKSTSRGRSPGRSASKSPRQSKSPGRSSSRSRSRRSRSRSASVSRKLPLNNDENDKESPTTPLRRKNSRQNKDKKEEMSINESQRRRSVRNMAHSSSTQFVSRVDKQKTDPATDEEDDGVVLRSTIAALAPQVRELSPRLPSKMETQVEKKRITLSYEEDKDSNVLLPHRRSKETIVEHSSTTSHEHSNAKQDLIRFVESEYFVSFLSVAAVLGSLIASQVLPRADDDVVHWRRWLPFLTPIVALLLFFHQSDARASAKWVATGLAWRTAAELLLLIGSLQELGTMVAGSVILANVSFLVALASVLRYGEHQQSKSTLALLTFGVLILFLSDSWVLTTKNSELESRVILMSIAVLVIALSPMPTVSAEDD